MRIVVIGAGIIGVTSAYYLRQHGFEVDVVERRGDVALETSYGNAGIIAPGYVTPWAAPGMPGKVLSYLFKSEAPVLFRPNLDPALWRWLARWLRECNLARYRVNHSAKRAITFSGATAGALSAATAAGRFSMCVNAPTPAGAPGFASALVRSFAPCVAAPTGTAPSSGARIITDQITIASAAMRTVATAAFAGRFRRGETRGRRMEGSVFWGAETARVFLGPHPLMHPLCPFNRHAQDEAWQFC